MVGAIVSNSWLVVIRDLSEVGLLKVGNFRIADYLSIKYFNRSVLRGKISGFLIPAGVGIRGSS